MDASLPSLSCDGEDDALNRFAMAEAGLQKSAIAEAAGRLHIPAVMMEKDFWVCWMLGLLFDPQDSWREALVFKGGTALSKVFGVLRRFSEDIDLSVAPEALGIEEMPMGEASSRKRRDGWMNELETACSQWVEHKLGPALNQKAEAVLGRPPESGSWLRFVPDAVNHSPTLRFHYPSVMMAGRTIF